MLTEGKELTIVHAHYVTYIPTIVFMTVCSLQGKMKMGKTWTESLHVVLFSSLELCSVSRRLNMGKTLWNDLAHYDTTIHKGDHLGVTYSPMTLIQVPILMIMSNR